MNCSPCPRRRAWLPGARSSATLRSSTPRKDLLGYSAANPALASPKTIASALLLRFRSRADVGVCRGGDRASRGERAELRRLAAACRQADDAVPVAGGLQRGGDWLFPSAGASKGHGAGVASRVAARVRDGLSGRLGPAAADDCSL